MNYASIFEEHAAHTPAAMPTMRTPGTYLRTDSVVVPGGQIAHFKDIMEHSSVRTTEFTPIQGTMVRISSQESSLPPSAQLTRLQNSQGEAVRENSFPPLGAMNALMKTASDNSYEGMTHAQEILCRPKPVLSGPSFAKVGSRWRLNSSPIPVSPSPSDLASSLNMDNTKIDIPPKKRTASRRSKFDPPYVYKCVKGKLRREETAENYKILKSLIPRPIKADRASILEETIAHVKNLGDQKASLEKIKHEKLKELCQQRAEKGQCQEWEMSGEANCLWMKRTSRGGTQVDIRIVQNEISVSVVQKHLPRFLLRMVTALESKLKLEILNVTGHVIDDFDVYNFRVEIKGSSCPQANEIMANIMETLDSVFLNHG
ncbi:protein MpBHLH9 [Marchantia polymorpha subsp. ruderalis]|uniref:BHLH domain-containing protein n=1 Tax=Marchantia polymorpha TaxID=3197 RepID=A0A2R6XDR3_MARPO|nr:hypothetical protein MARPO_0021s0101 [Marchantia polymorpha]BBN01320.1 hypothetical protein Mp_2g06460 [Marchantia polymorpha subsp. ruderalis]|eukprot:PTQ44245.1 hypothetical protein MARPO_0021s0101 [Marchantia polymorpha]